MAFEYTIYTNIPRNFDPEIEGVTIDSIIESCNDYIEHSIPLKSGNTIIKMTTSKPPNQKYLIEQLDDNFLNLMRKPSTVKKIERKSL